jgi:hypothetical protein
MLPLLPSSGCKRNIQKRLKTGAESCFETPYSVTTNMSHTLDDVRRKTGSLESNLKCAFLFTEIMSVLCCFLQIVAVCKGYCVLNLK